MWDPEKWDEPSSMTPLQIAAQNKTSDAETENLSFAGFFLAIRFFQEAMAWCTTNLTGCFSTGRPLYSAGELPKAVVGRILR